MNIFLTRKDLYKSVQDLDDDLLKSQIFLIRSILQLSELNKKEKEQVLKQSTPTVKYYINNLNFLSFWGMLCIAEYQFRFNESHPLKRFFTNQCKLRDVLLFNPPYNQAYFERQEYGEIKNSGTIKGAEKLMRRQLFWKWKSYSNPPKWTRRDKPSWAYNLIEKDSPTK